MVIKFDAFDRVEIPTMVLCNPNFQELYVIKPLRAPEMTLRFTATSEMSFTVAARDENGNAVPYYDLLTKNRVIHMDGFGYWVIAEPSDDLDGTTDKKEITCYSYEYMLSLRDVDLDEGTYKFYDKVSPDTTILAKIASKLPSWKIGYISDSLYNKYRTFELPDQSVYGFLTTEMAEAYEAIFVFDTENMIINAYDVADIVHDTDIAFTWWNVMKHAEISEASDPIITALDVYGSGNFSIRDVNPLGTPTIYKFDYFKDQMTPALWEKVSAWQTAVYAQMVSDAPGDYPALLTERKQLNTRILDMRADQDEVRAYLAAAKQVQDVQTPYSMQGASNNAVTSIYSWISGISEDELRLMLLSASAYPPINLDSPPADIASYASAVAVADRGIAQARIFTSACETCIKHIDASIAGVQEQIAAINVSIQAINDSLKFENYFTEEERLELDKFNFGSTYSNEYYVVSESMTYAEIQELAQELLEQGFSALEIASQPSYSFELDTINWLFLKEYQQYIDQLELGCIVHAEIREGEWVSPILLEMSFDFDDPSNLSMTWGNRYRLRTDEWTFADLYDQTSRTSAAVSRNFADMISPTRSGQMTEMRAFMDGALDAARNNILAGNHQAIQIDAHGMLFRKSVLNEDGSFTGEYEPEQLKLINNMLCFTDDDWLSVKSALGKIDLGNGNYTYGLVAESIFGNLIAGEQLVIQNEAGNFVVDSAGMSYSATSEGSNIYLSPTKGFGLQTKDENGEFVDRISLNMDGSIYVDSSITAVRKVGGWSNEDEAGLQKVGLSNFARLGGEAYAFSAGTVADGVESPNFSVSYDGILTAKNGSFSGTIASTAGSIGVLTAGSDGVTIRGNLTVVGNVVGNVAGGFPDVTPLTVTDGTTNYQLLLLDTTQSGSGGGTSYEVTYNVFQNLYDSTYVTVRESPSRSSSTTGAHIYYGEWCLYDQTYYDSSGTGKWWHVYAKCTYSPASESGVVTNISYLGSQSGWCNIGASSVDGPFTGRPAS